MLRTITRNERLVSGQLRRLIKDNAIRCAAPEFAKRIHLSRNAPVTKLKHPALWTIQFNRAYSSDLPSHTRVTLPALSPTMEMGTIVSWEKKEGDKLNEGDLLAEIETDKATMGFETPEEGYLAKIIVQAGSKEVPIGKLVCIIVEKEADITAFKDFKDTGGTATAAPVAEAPAAPMPSPPPPPQPVIAASIPSPTPSRPQTAVEQRGPRIYASPMAKRLAETQQIRLEGQGSGVFGSITSKDLAGMKAASAATSTSMGAVGGSPSGAAYYDVPVSSIRAVIAKRLLESKVTIPHYYLTVDINVDQVVKLRAKFNKKLEKEGVKLSLNDFIIKAVAVSSKKVPEVNSAWLGDIIRMFDSVDCSVAVDTPKGLLTPIVFQADRKGLVEISQTVKQLAAKARDGKLQPQEFQGGTISVSNLGMFGISHFCAVINPPQSAILAVGGTQKRIISTGENEYKESDFLTVTLSCDHRTVDGAVGARWLDHFKKCLEDPYAMLL